MIPEKFGRGKHDNFDFPRAIDSVSADANRCYILPGLYVRVIRLENNTKGVVEVKGLAKSR